MCLIGNAWNWTTDHATILAAVLSALATVAIAFFTVALVKVTSRQAAMTRESIDLARDEFLSTHRPKVIVSSFQMVSSSQLEVGEKVDFIFIARNIGDSPATVVEVRSATIVLRANARIPSDLSFPFKEEFNFQLASGERELLPGNGGRELVGNEPMEIFAEDKSLLCMGSIAYLDGGGRRRETGFCRRYRSRTGEWDTMSESEYEYAY